MIDKDRTRVREMCAKWIIRGKWPKLERIWMRIFQINSVKIGIAVDQCIDIILGDFQVLKQFDVNNIEGSILDLALRNNKAM